MRSSRRRAIPTCRAHNMPCPALQTRATKRTQSHFRTPGKRASEIYETNPCMRALPLVKSFFVCRFIVFWVHYKRPERRIGLCWEATRAPTPGLDQEGERSSPSRVLNSTAWDSTNAVNPRGSGGQRPPGVSSFLSAAGEAAADPCRDPLVEPAHLLLRCFVVTMYSPSTIA